jgi:hypothetical protein
MIFVSISNNGYFVLVPVQLIEYDVGYFELSSQSPPGDLLPQNREQLTQFPNIQRQMVGQTVSKKIPFQGVFFTNILSS